VWIAGAGALDAVRGGRVTTLRSGRGLPGFQVTSLLEDRAGRLWVGLDGTLTVYANGRFRSIDIADGSPVGLVVGITEDAHGDIWIEITGSPRKLIRIQGFTVRDVFPAPGMPEARRVAADPAGGIWLGLLSGDLARLRNGTLYVVPFAHNPSPSDGTGVNHLVVNADGSVLGATESGLIAWREGVARTLTVRNGLPCDRVHTFIADREGTLWLYAECGLVKIEKAQLDAWWRQPDVTVKTSILGALDGVRAAYAPFVAAAESSDGRLWFANGKALQMIDPLHVTRNLLPPPVHVEEVVANRKRYAPADGLRLPALTRDLEITYTALSLVVPQKVRFRYQLEGHDTDWVDPGPRRQAFYSDLRPGRYRFRVIACNNDGVWNETGATLAFSVAPAWYQTIWFRILVTALLITAGWSVHRLRVRQIAGSLSDRFDERLRERTRIARELHDTLLQTLQASKLVADDAMREGNAAGLQAAIARLSDWLGQAVQEGRDALNSLRSSTTQRNDLAKGLRRAADDCVQGTMAIAFSVDGESREMHPIARDEVFRTGCEAIRNACRHSAARHLEIELVYGVDLTLRVRDDGAGVDAAVAEHGKDGHFGISGMRERAAAVGGTLTIASARGSGTEITLVVPGRMIYRTFK
jgi:signal transduction histidine kinase